MPQPTDILTQIEALQTKEDSKHYLAGLFPSQRYHVSLPYEREDSNIFFSLGVVYILRKLKLWLSESERPTVDRISCGVIRLLPRYASPNNPHTFHFWRPDRGQHYPNGHLLSRVQRFALPDDADDTALAYLAGHPFTEAGLSAFRTALKRHANGNLRRSRDLPEKLASLPVHGCWFGSGRMPMEVEICILCNVLTWVFENNLELTPEDEASLEFIRIVLRDRDLFTHPELISNMYPDPVVILYHIGRLVHAMPHPPDHLEMSLLNAVLKEAEVLDDSVFRRMLLATTRLKCGLVSPRVQPPDRDDTASFSLFRAPMLSGTNRKVFNKRKFHPFWQVPFRCVAFNYAMILEHLVLHDAVSSPAKSIA